MINILDSYNRRGAIEGDENKLRFLIDSAREKENADHKALDRLDEQMILSLNSLKDLESQMGYSFSVNFESSDSTAAQLSYSHIARAFSQDYFNIYYVNIQSGEYTQYHTDPLYNGLKVVYRGDDFFDACEKAVEETVFEEDREYVKSMLTKDNLISNTQKHGTFFFVYRLYHEGKTVYAGLNAVLLQENDQKFLVIGVRNMDYQIRQKMEFNSMMASNAAYSSIIEALSRDYFRVYYVNLFDDSYETHMTNKHYEDIDKVEKSGNFFNDFRTVITGIAHQEDVEMILSTVNREALKKELEDDNVFTFTFRIGKGKDIEHISCKIIRPENDPGHIVVGFTNIEKQYQREKKYQKKLRKASVLAKKDALTGVKNKHAYQEDEKKLNKAVKDGRLEKFALIVCDLNNLKEVNDTKGHSMGDKYIQNASNLICSTFKHSPVFRIGGDEFAVILLGSDFEKRHELFSSLQDKARKNLNGEEIIMACGMSDFDKEKDRVVFDVFEKSGQGDVQKQKDKQK